MIDAVGLPVRDAGVTEESLETLASDAILTALWSTIPGTFPKRMRWLSTRRCTDGREGSRPERGEYGYLCPVDSRWSDNDIYGHNNVSTTAISIPPSIT